MSNNPFSASSKKTAGKPAAKAKAKKRKQIPSPDKEEEKASKSVVEDVVVVTAPERSVELVVDEALEPLTMDEKSCRSCAYYAFAEEVQRAHAATGECRRNAPVPGVNVHAIWPVSPWDRWCGEWENGVSTEDLVRMARDIGEGCNEGFSG